MTSETNFGTRSSYPGNVLGLVLGRNDEAHGPVGCDPCRPPAPAGLRSPPERGPPSRTIDAARGSLEGGSSRRRRSTPQRGERSSCQEAAPASLGPRAPTPARLHSSCTPWSLRIPLSVPSQGVSREVYTKYTVVPALCDTGAKIFPWVPRTVCIGIPGKPLERFLKMCTRTCEGKNPGLRRTPTTSALSTHPELAEDGPVQPPIKS
jgi:hypothetical protein